MGERSGAKGKGKGKDQGSLIRVSKKLLRASLEREPEFWQKNKEEVLEAADDVLPLAQPFPAGWSKNAGVKVAEEADMRRINKANEGVLVDRLVPKGDYRSMYEGAYLPVRWEIYVRSGGRYDAMTSVRDLFMAVQRVEGIAYGVAHLLREIRANAMRSFAQGFLPGIRAKATEEGIAEVLEMDDPPCKEIGGEPVREYRACMFVPLHFPDKLAQILVENVISRAHIDALNDKHGDDFPLHPMDSLVKMFMLGKPLIVTYDVEQEADPWKWSKLSEYV